jgi:hypothetical protein
VQQGGVPAADFARGGLDIRIILAPDADFIAGTGAPAGLDDALGRVIGQCGLMRAGFRHAVTALR